LNSAENCYSVQTGVIFSVRMTVAAYFSAWREIVPTKYRIWPERNAKRINEREPGTSRKMVTGNIYSAGKWNMAVESY
jgi:hypothetical protein